MSNKAIILFCLLFALIVFGMFQYAVLKNAERNQQNIQEPVTTQVDE